MKDKDDEKERAAKALKLNGFDYTPTTLNPISKQIGSKVKPTIRIKRLKHGLPIRMLKGASPIQMKLKAERDKAEKALKLNSLFG
jgi:hypothetical protein